MKANTIKDIQDTQALNKFQTFDSIQYSINRNSSGKGKYNFIQYKTTSKVNLNL